MYAPKRLHRTAELVTETQLRNLYDDDSEDVLAPRIETHDGA